MEVEGLLEGDQGEGRREGTTESNEGLNMITAFMKKSQ
jgi:hypothetical protein